MRIIDADRAKELIDATPTIRAIPVPDNATNGTMFKMLFPYVELNYDIKNKLYDTKFTDEWLDMPYEMEI